MVLTVIMHYGNEILKYILHQYQFRRTFINDDDLYAEIIHGERLSKFGHSQVQSSAMNTKYDCQNQQNEHINFDGELYIFHRHFNNNIEIEIFQCADWLS